jgi:hypothetical protein
MSSKIKNTISISLVIVFLLPMTTKLFDGLFHHHDHFSCTAKNEKHFHEHHKKCPIPNFELSFFSIEKQIHTTQKYYFSVEINDLYNFVNSCNNLKYSFLLRAPPIFTDKTRTS